MEYMSEPFSEQGDKPFIFLSGRCLVAQIGWFILEKDTHALVASLNRICWLTATPAGFNFYKIHDNLIFLFDPLSAVSDLSQTTLCNISRCE